MASKSSDPYSLKLTGPGHSFSREISEELANRVINLVLTGVAATTPASGSGAVGMANTAGDGSPAAGQLTPKQFMAQKRPSNNCERVACLAYYLTSYQNTPKFKTTDIRKLNTDAAAPRLSNPSVAVMHATDTYHYLSAAGGGKKQITTLGEAIVEALPDQEKVKAALAAHQPKRRKKRSPQKKRAK